MRWSSLALLFYCAIASSGCSASTAGKALVGSYNVMIASGGKSDPDVMTVTLGSGGAMLLTFEAGITTDQAGPNPDGLRATLMNSTMLTLEAQPVHIDHSTGELDGNVSGSGSIGADGTCNLKLLFTAVGSTAPSEYDVTGSRLM
jgi:hypothetical protein